jgi:hypothetical protein
LASDWSTPAATPASDNNVWKSKITSSSSTTDFKHVSEAPENLLLTPEDFDIVPEEVQADSDDWAITTIDANDADNWTVVTGEND